MAIDTKEKLNEYLKQDKLALGRNSDKPGFTDEIWKFEILLRKLEYRLDSGKTGGPSGIITRFYKLKFHKLSLKLGFTIPPHVFGPGLALPHYGTIVIHDEARVGRNCRVHDGVTIGATGGVRKSATIGDNVFLGSGCKIIGELTIADDVCIGAGAVVTKSITEPGTTWAGVPAVKVSDRDSHSNLNPALFGN